MAANKVRYGVIGLGHIAQAAVLPAFKHAENAELAALFSRDAEKLRTLGKQYGVKALGAYDDFETILRRERVDAVYIALPNHLHREFAIRAADAGSHVLCEKPMALTSRHCLDMIHAAEAARVKLMVAYRLHFDEANLSSVDLVESGVIGDARVFSSLFGFAVNPGNIRTRVETGGGLAYDIGVYCVNAARYLFRSEPLEIMAVESPKKVGDVSESLSVIMRFPEGRLANFICSFVISEISNYTLVGTSGRIDLFNAYQYKGEMVQRVTIGEESSRTKFKNRDQFAPELIYFSKCILENKEPEPSGYEGWADLRVLEAIQTSARMRRSVNLEPLRRNERPDLMLAIDRAPVTEPKLIHAESPKSAKVRKRRAA